MLDIMMSVISFILIFSFFVHELDKMNLNSTAKVLLATLLALPAFKVNSVIYIFEVHFVVIALICKLLLKKLLKADSALYKRLYVLIPVPLILNFSQKLN